MREHGLGLEAEGGVARRGRRPDGGLVVGAAPEAGGVAREATFKCRNTHGARNSKAVLKWTLTTQRGTEVLRTQKFFCKDNQTVTRKITQPNNANDWHLEIVVIRPNGSKRICTWDKDVTAGERQSFRRTCTASPKFAPLILKDL